MRISRALFLSIALGCCCVLASALNVPPHTLHHHKKAHLVATRRSAHRPSAVHASAKTPVHSRVVARTSSGRYARAHLRRASLHVRHRYYEHFTASSFASSDIFTGDVTTGEDPMIRQAAINALGGLNGTVVVINPDNGRILAMVNQKLALSPGAEPCSTIKITVAMAALSEGLVTPETMVQRPGFRMNMTQALARSNNLYFETLGRRLGFERVRHYAREFGLGELAGYNIPGEQLGEYPDEPLPDAEGGVGRMCSFGQGVSLTPLQLGAYVAALANGGTLYYLQHPTTAEEIADFTPRVKRQLDIAKYIPEMEEGMAGAVQFGTARRLGASFTEFPVFGKTGTCSNDGTRLGWFASLTKTPRGNLVTVMLLEGGYQVFGPKAAELTGVFYRNLQDDNYFAGKPEQASTTVTPPAAVETNQ
jgi:penicillin-binding protein 2